jgi:hypothetical protein
MVGDPVLGVVVGPDLVRPVARPDHRLAGSGIRLALLLPLGLLEPGAEHREGLGLVLVLALLILDLDDHAGRQVGDAHRRVGRVHRLPAGPR